MRSANLSNVRAQQCKLYSCVPVEDSKQSASLSKCESIELQAEVADGLNASPSGCKPKWRTHGGQVGVLKMANHAAVMFLLSAYSLYACCSSCACCSSIFSVLVAM
ncbi:hypothetical protein J1N35_042927 [Gossypium stocksii]|uniref:Uncharacterized protein n=1 Tax=Gossypium stocksii TaxID=47602 RepID=A0A9D3U6F7_9ROSI|nr:hypothetical protein J1N35_042927 [Gossypium stocksii]